MRIINGLWVVLVTVSALLTAAPLMAEVEEAPPNVVILFADDLGYGDLGSYGHPYIRTPNLDALAQGGQGWTDFYSAAPVCSPSRAGLLTGRHPVRTGEYGRQIRVYFPDEEGGFADEEITLAELLSEAGYRTGIFGKWHLGDRSHALPTRHGFDEWFGIPYSNDMDWEEGPDLDGMIRLRQTGQLEEIGKISTQRRALYAEPRPGAWLVPLIRSTRSSDGSESVEQIVERPAVQRTLTKRYTEEAINFIRRAGKEPFFVYLPYTMPHTPLFRSDDFVGKSLGGRYGDVIEEIDWSVGQIETALTNLGKLENTLVVFTSDNGPWLTMLIEGGRAGLLRMGKGTTFEGGMRVPGIFSWPGKIQPGVVSDIGSTLDLYRTVASFTGVSGSAGVDGFDLTPTLFRGADSPREELAYYRAGELFAYRVGPWKLHLRTEGAYGQPPELTIHAQPILHHLGRDPSERFDVRAANPKIVKMIQDKIAAHQTGLETKPPAMDRRLAALTKN
ncbi:MAG: sulfatase-like hydrolase/transferase [Pseudomonadales bacterium]|nr:sulfatase-like hydrolase/transferase [Pseudomonadales bacterium]